MDKDSAIKDIVGHFVQDAQDGIVQLGELDERLYRSCVAEYGYGKLAFDAEVMEAVVAGIKGRTFCAPGPEAAVTAKVAYDEKAIRSIFALLEKKADLEAFQYDVILSILSDQISPLIIGSGNIMTLFAYHAVRKLVEDLRNKKLQAQEMGKPTSMEEDTSYPVLDAPTYSSKQAGAGIPDDSEFDQFVGEGRVVERVRVEGGFSLTVQIVGGKFYDVFWPDEREYPPEDGSDVDVYGSTTYSGWYDVKPWNTLQAALTNEQLEEVGEGLAERAHERWIEREKAKGNEDDPNMVSYEDLPEGDKESDRDYAYEFMELLEENGFDIVPQEQ